MKRKRPTEGWAKHREPNRSRHSVSELESVVADVLVAGAALHAALSAYFVFACASSPRQETSPSPDTADRQAEAAAKKELAEMQSHAARHRDEIRVAEYHRDQWKAKAEAAETRQKQSDQNFIRKRDELDAWKSRAEAVEKRAGELAEALQALADVQNGPPLERTAHKWQEAVDRTNAALSAYAAANTRSRSPSAAAPVWHKGDVYWALRKEAEPAPAEAEGKA